MALHHSNGGFGMDAGWYIICDSCGMESDLYDSRADAKEDADAVGHLCAYCQ